MTSHEAKEIKKVIKILLFNMRKNHNINQEQYESMVERISNTQIIKGTADDYIKILNRG